MAHAFNTTENDPMVVAINKKLTEPDTFWKSGHRVVSRGAVSEPSQVVAIAMTLSQWRKVLGIDNE